jgi:hypothetical protein
MTINIGPVDVATLVIIMWNFIVLLCIAIDEDFRKHSLWEWICSYMKSSNWFGKLYGFIIIIFSMLAIILYYMAIISLFIIKLLWKLGRKKNT